MRHSVDVVVVGRGMMGSSVASHLARMHPETSLVLIGPGEPSNRGEREIFGAHYDEGRITRRTDRSPLWASLAACSIDRYREVEHESGIDFYHEVGHLAIGLEHSDYINSVVANAKADNVTHVVVDDQDLVVRCPWLCLPPGAAFSGVSEPAAGWISAREHVRAHSAIASSHGCTIVDDDVLRVERADGGFEVHAASGDVWFCRRAVVAAGAFTNNRPLLPAADNGAHVQLELQLLTAQVATTCWLLQATF